VDVLKYQGKTWGIPAGVDPIMMYYNKRLFDAAGVPYPQPGWTWDDFLAAGLAISKPDERVFGYAMPQSADSFDLPVFVYSHDGRLFDDLSNPTAVTFDDPKTIEAVEWYTDLVLRHNIAPTPEQARGFYGGGNQGIFRGVYEGKFGLWSGFFTDRGGRTWPVEWVEPWGMVTMPRDANDATLGPVLAYFLIADQPNPDACWQWVTFLSEQTAPGLAPARRTLAESDAFAQEVGAEQAAAVRSALDNAIFISPQAAQAGEALPAFGNAGREVLSGKTTVEEALLAAQQQAENALPQQ
jgi:multiple sugar transport system substrate-binding protein